MCRLLLFIILFSPCLKGHTQQRTIDSLNHILGKYPRQDSNYLNLLNTLSTKYKNVDESKGLEVANQAVLLAQKLQMQTKLANAFVNKSTYLSNADSVVHYLAKARDLYEKSNDINAMLDVQNKIVLHYEQQRDFEEMRNSAERGVAICDKYHLTKEKTKFWVTAGTALLYLIRYAEALPNFQKALLAAERVSDKKTMAHAHLRIGIVYASMEERNKAVEAYKKALVLFEELDHVAGVSSALNNIATQYTEMKEYKQSISYLERAYILNEKNGNKSQMRTNLHNLAYAYQSQNEIGKAIESRKKILAIIDKSEGDTPLEEALVEVANLYSYAPDSILVANGISPANKYKDAIAANLRFIGYMRNNNASILSLRQSYLELSMLYEKDKDFANALKEFKNYLGIRDSIIDVDKQKELTKLDLNYAFSKKEDSLNMRQQITNAQLQQQKLLGIQQQQALALVEKEKDLQHLAYLNQQVLFKSEQSARQNEAARARFNDTIQIQQIEKQQIRIRADRKFKSVMAGVVLLVVAVAGYFAYSQMRTSRLNKKIVAQSKELADKTQELQLQKEELQTVNGIKDRLFSVISHDLRTPVNSLLTLSMMLDKGNISPEKMTQYASMLQNDLGHTAGLLENLLNFAKSQMGGYRPYLEVFPINDVVVDTVALLKQTASAKQITIQNSTDPTIQVYADFSMTALIIRNLISNAIKYSHPQGVITIAVSQQEDRTYLTILDKGVGMNAELVKAINNENKVADYNSTPGTRNEKGTGLGLMLCKNFALLMDGKLRVESRLGDGSCFILQLPKSV
jgi:signal transduction histidine kinase/tetratricopeptide (TPR) repeat protein